MTCFVRWAQRFLIVRLLSSAWARVRSRKLQFRYSLHGCGGRGLLSDLTLLVAIEQYRAHRIFVRVKRNFRKRERYGGRGVLSDLTALAETAGHDGPSAHVQVLSDFLLLTEDWCWLP